MPVASLWHRSKDCPSAQGEAVRHSPVAGPWRPGSTGAPGRPGRDRSSSRHRSPLQSGREIISGSFGGACRALRQRTSRARPLPRGRASWRRSRPRNRPPRSDLFSGGEAGRSNTMPQAARRGFRRPGFACVSNSPAFSDELFRSAAPILASFLRQKSCRKPMVFGQSRARRRSFCTARRAVKASASTMLPFIREFKDQVA